MARPPEALDIHPDIRQFLKKQLAKSENTYEARRGDVNNFWEWLQEQGHELEEVGPWVIDDYFTDQVRQDYAPNTIGSRWDSLNQLFRFLSLRDIVEENPFRSEEIRRRDYTRSRKREHTEGIRFVTKEELDTLVENVPKPLLRNRLLLRLMFQTGVRTNEATRIRISDMDREERSIEVFDKKTGDRRTVYYQESLDFLLTQWLDHGYRMAFPYAEQSDFLFVSRQTDRLPDKHVNKVVKEAAENAGIQEELYTDKKGHTRVKVTAHSLRHGHGRYSLLCGIDIRRVQEHMGHDSLEMTKEYLDLIDEDVRDAYRENWGRA